MNVQLAQEPQTNAWSLPRNTPDISDAGLMERWEKTTTSIRELAQKNQWSKSEIGRQADVATGTFSQWYDGKYNGRYDNVTAKLENFLASQMQSHSAVSAIPKVPGYIETPTARELRTAFMFAQAMPTIAVVTVGSGMGKSFAASEYKSKNPHVLHVELSPDATTSIHKMMLKIAEVMNLNIGSSSKVEAGILKALQKNGSNMLLIIDEAQNLNDELINQLRHFRDIAECGIVLLGNDETTTPYAGTKIVAGASPQIFRRIGHRFTRLKPTAEDIAMYVDAWGIKDKGARELAAKIAHKNGTLGTLKETIFAAAMIARGNDRAITAEDMKAAWDNRGAGFL